MIHSEDIKDLAARFWAKVNKTDSCWLFTSSLNRLGYGQFSVNRKVKKAHRVAWFLHNGDLPNDLKVLHKCDVRNCVNPDHLFLGTQIENIRDMVEKGRNRNKPQHGEKNPMAKYNADLVRAVREEYAKGNLSQKKVAILFGMSTMNVNRIVNKKLWGHIV